MANLAVGEVQPIEEKGGGGEVARTEAQRVAKTQAQALPWRGHSGKHTTVGSTQAETQSHTQTGDWVQDVDAATQTQTGGWVEHVDAESGRDYFVGAGGKRVWAARPWERDVERGRGVVRVGMERVGGERERGSVG